MPDEAPVTRAVPREWVIRGTPDLALTLCVYALKWADMLLLSRTRTRNADRHPAAARRVHLSRRPPGGAARHAVLRPASGPGWAAHDPVFHSSPPAAARGDDDQCVGAGDGDGPDHARPKHPAARTRRTDQRQAAPHGPSQQGAAIDRHGSRTAAGRVPGLEGCATRVCERLWQ